MKTQRINKVQALSVALTSIVAAVFQPVFRDFLLWSGNGAWLPILLAGGLSVIVMLVTVTLADRFPTQSATEYLPVIWGKWIGYPLCLGLLAIFFLKGAIALRYISEFFVTVVLPETPISSVLVIMLIVIGYAVSTQLEGIVRFNQLVLPIILISMVVVLFGSLPNLSAWNLLPLFDQGLDGIIPSLATGASYLLNSTALLFIYPAIVDKPGIKGWTARMSITASLIFLLLYLDVLLYAGTSLGQILTWPFLTVADSLRIGLERGEVLFMIIWMMAATSKLSLFFYICSLGVSQIIPKLKVGWVGLASLPAAAYLAMRPQNLPAALNDHTLLHRIALIFHIGVPVLSLGVALLRGKRGDMPDEQAAN